MRWSFQNLPAERQLELRGLRQGSSFLGVIDKARYPIPFSGWTLEPRWKSEFRRQTPLLAAEGKRLELDQLLMLVVRFPMLQRTFVEGGLEYEWFKQLKDPIPPGADPTFTGLTSLVQVTNLSDYLGYRVATIVGFEVARLDFEFQPAQVRTRGFITLYAGVER